MAVPRPAVALALGVAGLAACERAPVPPAASHPPSLLLVTVDTLRADHCSLHGYDRPTTPELEALGKRGVVYEHATATASYTQGSVASILTGLYPFEHGASEHPSRMRADVETLAEALRARGYATGAVVTNPILRPEHGYDQGFQAYRFEKLQLEEAPGGGKRPVLRAAERTTDLALAELAKLEPPFFLWVHYMDPHWLYTPPAPHDTAFSPGDAAWNALAEGSLAGSPSIDQVYFGPQPPAIEARGRDLYDGEIAYTDREIGRLVRGLAGRGLDDETLAVVTADHGESMGEHGIRFCHGFFTYEDNLHVPLLVVPPSGSGEKARRVPDPLSLVDLKPLVLARLGHGPPPGAPRPILGESEPLYDEARRPNIPGRPRAVVTGERGKWRSIREGALKLVVVPTGEFAAELELYDLASDPGERHDLADERPKDRDRLLAALLAALPPNVAPATPSPLPSGTALATEAPAR